jgi:hypothetical protein
MGDLLFGTIVLVEWIGFDPENHLTSISEKSHLSLNAFPNHQAPCRSDWDLSGGNGAGAGGSPGRFGWLTGEGRGCLYGFITGGNGRGNVRGWNS